MMLRPLPSLRRCDQGASVIELALAAPLLATLLIGMVDLSNAYSAKLQLEQAAQRTVEKLMNGTSFSDSDYAALQGEAATAAGVAPANVTTDRWLECNGSRQGSYSTTCPSGQTYARYVSVQVSKPFMPTFGTRFFPGANANGSFTLTARAGIRIQ